MKKDEDSETAAQIAIFSLGPRPDTEALWQLHGDAMERGASRIDELYCSGVKVPEF